MYRQINAPSNVNNVVDGLNDTDKCYLKYQMELPGNFQVPTHQI